MVEAKTETKKRSRTVVKGAEVSEEIKAAFAETLPNKVITGTGVDSEKNALRLRKILSGITGRKV